MDILFIYDNSNASKQNLSKLYKRNLKNISIIVFGLSVIANK